MKFPVTTAVHAMTPIEQEIIDLLKRRKFLQILANFARLKKFLSNV